jgi:hypothetical protein
LIEEQTADELVVVDCGNVGLLSLGRQIRISEKKIPFFLALGATERENDVVIR